ncbi:MAG: hypothetical protein J6S26_00060 [Solobacterium sp.]|nr:hypothetical protein [Solobacterium sp.]
MDHKDDYLTDEADAFNADSGREKEEQEMMDDLEDMLETPEEDMDDEAAQIFLSLFPEEILDLTREAILLEDEIVKADPLQARLLKTKLDSIRRDILTILSEETDPSSRKQKLMN